MTAEFGTVHYYSSLEEHSEACLCSSLDTQDLKKKHVSLIFQEQSLKMGTFSCQNDP